MCGFIKLHLRRRKADKFFVPRLRKLQLSVCRYVSHSRLQANIPLDRAMKPSSHEGFSFFKNLVCVWWNRLKGEECICYPIIFVSTRDLGLLESRTSHNMTTCV